MAWEIEKQKKDNIDLSNVYLARFCNLYFVGFQLVRDVDLIERTRETNTHTIERNSSQII